MKTYTHAPLIAARKKLELSIDDMVRELYAKYEMKVSGSTLESWERGETKPDADKLPQLLAILKLKFEDLFETRDA